MLLAFTVFDTLDDLGRPRSCCRPGSDVIEIDGDDNDEQWRMLDPAPTNSYPKTVLEAEVLLAPPTFFEVGGWGYRVGIGANSFAFNNFMRLASLSSRPGLSVPIKAPKPPASIGFRNSSRRAKHLPLVMNRGADA